MKIDFSIDNFYSKQEIEKEFSTNFGPRIKGITLRRSLDGDPYILLFASAKGAFVYGDKVDNDIFYYKGEGVEGDQKLTTANKALRDSNLTERPIYGFRQEEEGGKYRYLGLVSVIDWAYVDFNGRKVYDFKLKQEQIEDFPERTPEGEKLIKESELPEPSLTGSGEKVSTKANSVKRDSAFRLKIKKLYGNACAMCGAKRFTAAAYPEVQAAHIFPKEKNGSDDLRNGIALCRLHHWAFDGGLLAITDDRKILIRAEIKGQDDYLQITQHEGESILLPSEIKYTPIPLFLAAHRKVHGFD